MIRWRLGRAFNDWCRGEEVKPAAIVQLARVFRAVHLAAVGHCGFREFLDADYRTVRELIARSGIDKASLARATPKDVCRSQSYFENATLIDEILLVLAARAGNA